MRKQTGTASVGLELTGGAEAVNVLSKLLNLLEQIAQVSGGKGGRGGASVNAPNVAGGSAFTGGGQAMYSAEPTNAQGGVQGGPGGVSTFTLNNVQSVLITAQNVVVNGGGGSGGGPGTGPVVQPTSGSQQAAQSGGGGAGGAGGSGGGGGAGGSGGGLPFSINAQGLLGHFGRVLAAGAGINAAADLLISMPSQYQNLIASQGMQASSGSLSNFYDLERGKMQANMPISALRSAGLGYVPGISQILSAWESNNERNFMNMAGDRTSLQNQIMNPGAARTLGVLHKLSGVGGIHDGFYEPGSKLDRYNKIARTAVQAESNYTEAQGRLGYRIGALGIENMSEADQERFMLGIGTKGYGKPLIGALGNIVGSANPFENEHVLNAMSGRTDKKGFSASMAGGLSAMQAAFFRGDAEGGLSMLNTWNSLSKMIPGAAGIVSAGQNMAQNSRIMMGHMIESSTLGSQATGSLFKGASPGAYGDTLKASMAAKRQAYTMKKALFDTMEEGQTKEIARSELMQMESELLQGENTSVMAPLSMSLSISGSQLSATSSRMDLQRLSGGSFAGRAGGYKDIRQNVRGQITQIERTLSGGGLTQQQSEEMRAQLEQLRLQERMSLRQGTDDQYGERGSYAALKTSESYSGMVTAQLLGSGTEFGRQAETFFKDNAEQLKIQKEQLSVLKDQKAISISEYNVRLASIQRAEADNAMAGTQAAFGAIGMDISRDSAYASGSGIRAGMSAFRTGSFSSEAQGFYGSQRAHLQSKRANQQRLLDKMKEEGMNSNNPAYAQKVAELASIDNELLQNDMQSATWQGGLDYGVRSSELSLQRAALTQTFSARGSIRDTLAKSRNLVGERINDLEAKLNNPATSPDAKKLIMMQINQARQEQVGFTASLEGDFLERMTSETINASGNFRFAAAGFTKREAGLAYDGMAKSRGYSEGELDQFDPGRFFGGGQASAERRLTRGERLYGKYSNTNMPSVFRDASLSKAAEGAVQLSGAIEIRATIVDGAGNQVAKTRDAINIGAQSLQATFSTDRGQMA